MTHELNGHFSELADHYNSVRFTDPEPIKVLAASIPRPKVWADVGCGTGRYTSLLLKRFPTSRAYAVDRSQKMLGECCLLYTSPSPRDRS